MRYLLRPITNLGRPSMGTLNSLTGEYKSDANAIRYMTLRLGRYDNLPAGQYQLETFPKDSDGWNGKPPNQFVAILYRKA